MSDPATTKAAAGLAAASGGATWIVLVKGWVLELFGVPLHVFLAASAGAFFARTFLAPGPFLRALVGWTGWTLIGGFGADLAHGAVVLVFPSAVLPAGTTLGLAALVASLGTIFITPEMVQKIRGAIGRRIDSFWRS